METIVFLVFAFLCLVVYFLPTVVSYRRFHPQAAPIFILNLFLGWTLLGWAIAMAWSVSQVKGARV